MDENAIADAQEGPRRFYHYTSIDSPERRSWFERIVVGNEIYFRSRAQLNDPNELRPGFVLKGTDAQIRDYVRTRLMPHARPMSPGARMLEERRLVRAYRSLHPERMEANLHEQLARLGMFSVSEAPDVPQQWAYYANGHRGLTIEFDATRGPFLTAQPVAYPHEPPVIDRLSDDQASMLEKALFTKNRTWSHEREWRLIARWSDETRIDHYIRQHALPPEAEDFMRSQSGPGYYIIPPGTVTAVILGHGMPVADAAYVRELVARAPGVAIRQASLARNGSVTIEDAP